MEKELLHGTLEVLVLKTLSWGPMHGFGIGKWIDPDTGAPAEGASPPHLDDDWR